MKNFFQWYNQGLEYFSRNWCSVYTLFMIIQLQWGIKYKNEFIIKTLKEAEKDKTFFSTRGAYFQVIYDWFIKAIFNYTEIKVRVRTVNIMSKEFEDLYNMNYAFWLWLKYAWLWYRSSRKDWTITIEEVKNFNWTRVYWHNHAFYKTKKGWVIFDSLKTVTWKPIFMSLEVLREAVKKWIYYSNARTLVLEDQRLDKRLRFFKKGGKINDITKLPKIQQKAIERSLKLRVFKK